MLVNEKYDIWEEKYRPQIIDDIILPKKLKDKFKKYLDTDSLTNMLLVSSTPGLGKTTLSHIIKNTLESETKWINASRDNGVDTIRYTVERFCESGSYNMKKKLLIMDEADSLTQGTKTAPGSQEILRGTIEMYSAGTRFILTANYIDRFIEPLLSRLEVIDLDKEFQDAKMEIGKEMFLRLKYILENENIEYSDSDVKNIMMEHFPSMRNMTVALNANIQGNKLIITNTNVFNEYETILKLAIAKDFTKTRSELLLLTNCTTFYTWLWKNADKYFEPRKLVPLFTNLALHQDMDSRAKNKQITLMSFLIKVMEIV
jgi:replication factor C small subunit